MKSARSHDGESWANIMLTNSQRLTTGEDQKAFWNWIMDPTDERDQVIEYTDCNTNEHIPAVYTVQDDTDEKTQTIECHNTVTRNGLTTYIHTRCGEFENLTLETPSVSHEECKSAPMSPIGPIPI